MSGMRHPTAFMVQLAHCSLSNSGVVWPQCRVARLSCRAVKVFSVVLARQNCQTCSCSRHNLVIDLNRLVIRVETMLVLHVPAPIVLARDRLTPNLGVGAGRLGAMILSGLHMLVVDVTVQMSLGAELATTAVVRTLVWSLVVPLVMVELVNLVKHAAAFLAGKCPRRSV